MYEFHLMLDNNIDFFLVKQLFILVYMLRGEMNGQCANHVCLVRVLLTIISGFVCNNSMYIMYRR